jgi:hypothetical protein
LALRRASAWRRNSKLFLAGFSREARLPALRNLETDLEFLLGPHQLELSLDHSELAHWFRPEPAKSDPFSVGEDTQVDSRWILCGTVPLGANMLLAALDNMPKASPRDGRSQVCFSCNPLQTKQRSSHGIRS